MKKQTAVRVLAFVLALVSVIPFITSCKNNKKTQTTTTTTTTVTKPYNPNDFLYSGEKVELYSDKVKPVIYVDPSDYKQSVRAVKDLQKDFERVTGTKPAIVSNEKDLKGADIAIIIGTLGQSSFISELESVGRIGLDEIKDKWEGYNISVVENLTEDVKKAVVIAGSDKRGTVYGTYELSELIGVSPWYYWGDVEIEHADTIELPIEKLTQTEIPDVKYRGIFINDEEYFTDWSAAFIDKNSPGKPNPGAYELVFELILRLKANTLWPAMHACSDAFYKYKNPKTGISYNAELADDFGVVMSASHCEMLQRNNEGEWRQWAADNANKYNITKVDNDWGKSYDYTVNAKAMNAYWEERVAECYRFENIFMIGLRGVHDSGINCSKLTDTSYRGKAKVVKKAVEAQLEILAKYEKKLSEETGKEVKFQTAYCVYKEAAEYFKYDLGLPKDCCLTYSDDNHGYIRSTVSDKDKEKYESFGMYYHVSYWGRPASYLWMSSTPLQIIAEEMRKAYYTGTDDLWILNVGDIKPAEVKTEYFMDLAWDIESHTEHNTEEFTVEFLKQNFALDDTTAKKFASTYTEFNMLMRSYYPEIIDKHSNKGNYDLSVENYGSEAFVMVDKLTAIYNESLAIYKSLPEAKQDSFYELFHYTIYSYLLSIEEHAYAQMNEICYNQGRFASANIYADLAENAYYAIQAEIARYNSEIAGGKWDKIMNPFKGSNPAPEGAPVVKRFAASDTAKGVGASAEGHRTLTKELTLKFGSLNDDIRFVDLFNKGLTAESWSMSLPSFIIVKDGAGKVLTGNTQGENTVYSGTIDVEERLFLSVDWEKFAKGETKTGKLTVADNYGASYTVDISATKHSLDPKSESTKGYYEENGLVSIEAEHFTDNVERNGYKWTYIDGLGRSGGVMMALNTTENKGFVNYRNTKEIKTSAPYVEYKIYFTTTGTYYGTFYRLPTLNESASGKSYCTTGWSFDDAAVKQMNGTTTADDSDHNPWGNMIKLHMEELSMTIKVDKAGWHTLRIYMVNSLQAFDKIVLNTDKNVTSRFDAPETFNTVSDWQHAPAADLPETTFNGINWVKYQALYDFTKSDVQEGYTKVDTSKGALNSWGWEWDSTDAITGYMRSIGTVHTLDNGFISATENATFRIKTSGAGKYMIGISVGDPQGAIKAKNMSVVSGSDTLISGINVNSGIKYYCFVAEADESGIISLTFKGEPWVVGSLEVYTYAQPEVSGNGAFTANKDGNIVIEAESALENSEFANTTASTDNKAHTWEVAAGQYGSAMFFGPNKGDSYSSTSVTSSESAKLSFKVNIEKTGGYAVWALVKCPGDKDDSVIMALGNKQAIVKNDIRESSGYIWVQIGSVTVTETGITDFVVMGREDGFTIDRIILQGPGAILNVNGESVRAQV